MRTSILSLSVALVLAPHSFGAFTISVQVGELLDSTSNPVSDTSIWAIIYDADGDGILPGGLGVNSSFDSGSSVVSAYTAFSGGTISTNTMIGADRILWAGIVDGENTSGVPAIAGFELAISSFANAGVQASGIWGIYWFPGLTNSARELNTSSFQVGGIQINSADSLSGGDIGMSFPVNDNTGNTYNANFYGETNGGVKPDSYFTPIIASALAWDTNNSTPGAQGGDGTWDTTTTNWNAGSSNYAWATSGTNNDAVFGGTAGTVTISTAVTANDLTFNTTGYIIEGGTLTLNGTTPTVTTATGVTATISSAIQGSAGLTKEGAGTLILGETSSYTGATLINEGKLEMGDAATDNFATTSVVVGAGGKLAGRGTIAGSLAVSGILAPGNDSIGTLTAGETTWNGGASGIWEFSLGTPSVSDKLIINGNFTKGTGSTFQFDFMSSVPGNGTYTLVDWSGSANFLFSNFSYTGLSGAYAGSFFTINGSQLDFTAVPEPTSALAGLLIIAGLLRRRRA